MVASKLLRVAVDQDNSPFSFRANGTMTGIDVDIATALANALGVEVELIPRIQGEDVDTDLRANVWKGPLLGGPVGDVMMHVPLDRELALRNREAVLANPYFEQRIALGYDPAKIGPEISFDVFKREKVGVRLGSVADYFVMFADGGALRNNVLHFIKPSDGVKRFLDKEMAAILGVRSELKACCTRPEPKLRSQSHRCPASSGRAGSSALPSRTTAAIWGMRSGLRSTR